MVTRGVAFASLTGDFLSPYTFFSFRLVGLLLFCLSATKGRNTTLKKSRGLVGEGGPQKNTKIQKGWSMPVRQKEKEKKKQSDTKDCWWRWFWAGKLCVIANTNLTFMSNTSPGRNFPNCKNHRDERMRVKWLLVIVEIFLSSLFFLLTRISWLMLPDRDSHRTDIKIPFRFCRNSWQKAMIPKIWKTKMLLRAGFAIC